MPVFESECKYLSNLQIFQIQLFEQNSKKKTCCYDSTDIYVTILASHFAIWWVARSITEALFQSGRGENTDHTDAPGKSIQSYIFQYLFHTKNVNFVNYYYLFLNLFTVFCFFFHGKFTICTLQVVISTNIACWYNLVCLLCVFLQNDTFQWWAFVIPR